MSSIKFEVKMNNLAQVKELSDEAVARGLELCGAQWESAAKQEAPVDTGRLRNSIEHHAEGKDKMVVSTNVEYAIYQEMGTRYQSGTPFIKPSGESNVGTFKQILESELNQ